ncbi:pyrroloquinoline quinone precursor peptide PqqA [Streptomyces sp. PR69]|nr:pyrroloquinoline quinone precursor peptide PqqA [Streptomyces sp. PR69]
MRDTEEQETEPVEQAPSPETTDKAAWQTPDYEVVDTALEVTGYYSPSSR